jgi:adenylate cyclase
MDCTVLFADVAGSTALYEILGDDRAFALVGSCLQTMSDCTAEIHGRVVKTIGDAVMGVFEDADSAAAAAAEMQMRVEKLGTALGARLGLRIGFHHGSVVEHDNDVFGDTVNLASRLCDLASKGQIITDKDTAQGLSSMFTGNLRKLYSIPVKGKEMEVDLIEIVWQGANQDMTSITAAPMRTGGNALLELEMEGRRIDMGPERRKVTVGRDHEADYTIHNGVVSRAHAMIERRRDHFVLVDHSSNGTFVTVEGQPEVKVHREEMSLFGHGWIAFGEPRTQAKQTAEYRCVETWSPDPNN